VFVVHGTKKFLDRVGLPGSGEVPTTTVLGNWYATAVFWQPQAALFVNEKTLLPVVVPLAPAAGVVERFPTFMAEVLTVLGINGSFVDAEVSEMSDHVLTKTQSRSVLGSMNDFVHLGKLHAGAQTAYDPLDLSLQLADVPCGPLYRSHTFPAEELRALVSQWMET
jgi:hypothetical protein